MPRTTPIQPFDPFVGDDLVLTKQNQDVMRTLQSWVPITGNGSPEGKFEALQFRLYIDVDGTTGTLLYIKKFAEIADDITQGWVLV